MPVLYTGRDAARARCESVDHGVLGPPRKHVQVVYRRAGGRAPLRGWLQGGLPIWLQIMLRDGRLRDAVAQRPLPVRLG